jgi:hypothetical protein
MEVDMNGINRIGIDSDARLDKFAAELTEAAYRVALRHGVGGSWLDLELDLWHALTDAVRNKGRELSARREAVAAAERAMPRVAHATA